MDIQSIVLWGVVVLAFVASAKLPSAWAQISASFGMLILFVFSLRGGSAFWAVVLGTLSLTLFMLGLVAGIKVQRGSRDKAAQSRTARQQRHNSDAAKSARLVASRKTLPEVRDLEEIMDGWRNTPQPDQRPSEWAI